MTDLINEIKEQASDNKVSIEVMIELRKLQLLEEISTLLKIAMDGNNYEYDYGSEAENKSSTAYGN